MDLYYGQPKHQSLARSERSTSGPQTPNEEVQERIVIVVQFGFEDKEVRLRFIRKVYLLLLAQILITAGITSVCLFVKPVNEFLREHYWIQYVLLAVTIIMFILISCCEAIRRTVPLNFFCLFFCNIVIGVLLGIIAANYSLISILIAAGVTFLIFLALTVFAFQTRWDITTLGGIIFVVSLCVVAFGFIAIFLRGIFPILQIVYAGVMTVLLCVYIVFDTQMLIGGRHKHSISPEEYIYASFNLYVDIVYLFCMMMSCNCGR
ncbi:unnamed protein product [Allacma fusca]|uniref:Protein lifeguard 1 n=1 Tax=Allacma fusca TaxID=39272 RepID=A0A8J2J8I6_9HEXA|nr:unnamed protein product [Allacma fusca]